MLVPLMYVDGAAGPPEVMRLCETYLREFDDLAPRAELESTLDLACRVAKIARTLTWQRALVNADGEYASAPVQSFASIERESFR